MGVLDRGAIIEVEAHLASLYINRGAAVYDQPEEANKAVNPASVRRK